MEAVFWICVFATLYPYTVFPTILWAGSKVAGVADRQPKSGEEDADVEPFTMVVPAHNEEINVGEKIRETIPLLEKHPQSVLLIVSDHSTDNTVAVASAIVHPQVRVLENKLGRGRALATNFAVGLARTEFLVFTDIETRVPAETIRAMIYALRRERVGCVNAEIVLSHAPEDNVSEAAGLYWRFEMALRTLETRLGLYATASGPCMASRRSLFRELPPTGDVDFTTPLDVVEQGYRCAHLAGCIAFDVMPVNASAEFKARARQVAKNFSGTLSRWGLRNALRHPLYTWALYSHKILRWLMPFFLLAAFLSNASLIGHNWIYDLTLVLQVAFYLMAVVGWFGYRKKKAWPFVEKMYAFALAHLAFFVGVLQVATGRVPAFYIPTRQIRK
jgi:cellulose synthase/poly-beta-1,6-N-acetylglucosamine synthase-like glycosyltransferase